jgi:diaminohydroxyphosphoribosylaminopyrimidine deaminase/5-amino-6-(5-phosphoribosylamino)uracil reductase
VLLLTGKAGRSRGRALARPGVSVLALPTAKGRIALRPALRALRARGILSLMVEGGSEVLGSFLQARAVDEIALFRAPILLGGRGSRPAFGGDDPGEIAQALRVERVPEDPAFPWPWPPRFELWRPRR